MVQIGKSNIKLHRSLYETAISVTVFGKGSSEFLTCLREKINAAGWLQRASEIGMSFWPEPAT
jgi:hypothetical protein